MKSAAMVEVKMAVDRFQIKTRAEENKRMRIGKIISIDYDEETNVLYATFAPVKIDSESLDGEGMVPFGRY